MTQAGSASASTQRGATYLQGICGILKGLLHLPWPKLPQITPTLGTAAVALLAGQSFEVCLP